MKGPFDVKSWVLTFEIFNITYTLKNFGFFTVFLPSGFFPNFLKISGIRDFFLVSGFLSPGFLIPGIGIFLNFGIFIPELFIPGIPVFFSFGIFFRGMGNPFFQTRPSDEYDSAPSRKYSRPLLDFFACIGWNQDHLN